MKQYEAVMAALERLGGIATLGALNVEVFKIKGCEWRTKTPYASIRRIVQQTKGIYRIKPGLYGLEKYRSRLEAQGFVVEDEKNADSASVALLNHTYYQGLLITIGNCKKFFTFIPKQDKNKRFYDGRTLQMLASLEEQPSYSYPELCSRSATIDTIWFNDRRMPHSFFEVEHSTDIQNSWLKFNDLQDFYARMVIVADAKRRREFEEKMKYHAFEELRVNKRVTFLSYEALVRQYEMEMEKQRLDFLL